MSDIASGRVSKVYVNTFDDGGKSISFKIDGDRRYFRTGRNRFEGILEEGAHIKFKYEPVSDKAAKVIGTPKKGSGSSAPAESSPTGAGRGFGSNDAAIRYQSSRKDALEMAKLVVQTEALKLPAKQDAKLAVLEALVDRYTAAFYADIETKGAVGRVTPAPKAEEPEAEEPEADEPEAEDDEWD